jgi:DHA3 family macrolide efflux protein-like MFS transporter
LTAALDQEAVIEPLLTNRSFARVWLASIVANLALSVATITETWYVVTVLDAKERLGLVIIAMSVPRVLLMVIGGVVADRMRRSTILVVSLLVRVALMFGVALLLRFGRLELWGLTLFAFAYGSLDAFFWPARDALLPGIVAKDDLGRANSIMLTTNQIGLVIGPVVGAGLLAALSYAQIFTITGLALALGALLLSLVREASFERRSATRHMMEELREGVGYMLASPVLRALMLIYGVANLLFIGPLGLGIPIVASDNLRGTAVDLSLLESALAAGMFAAGLLHSVWSPRGKRLLTITVVIAFEGLCVAGLAYTTHLFPAMVLQFLIGFGIITNNVPMISLLQEASDPTRIGRIMSLNTVASMGLAPISNAMVTALLSLGVGIVWIMPAFGLTMAALMIVLALRLPIIRQTV